MGLLPVGPRTVPGGSDPGERSDPLLLPTSPLIAVPAPENEGGGTPTTLGASQVRVPGNRLKGFRGLLFSLLF